MALEEPSQFFSAAAEAPCPLVRLKWCILKLKLKNNQRTIMHFNQDRSGISLVLYASTHSRSHIWKAFSYNVYHNQLLLLLNCSQHVSIQFYFTMNCSYYGGEEPVVNFSFSCCFFIIRMSFTFYPVFCSAYVLWQRAG